MPSTSDLVANFNSLNKDSKKAIYALIEIIRANDSEPREVVRKNGRGLESKAVEREDDEVRKPGRPRKNEEVSAKRGPGRPRKEDVDEPKRKPGRPAKEETAPKVSAKTPATNGSSDLYSTLKLSAKGKDEKKSELASLIKKVEKFVNNDKSWQEAKAYAEKKGVTLVFGRGKPSNDLNKRKIAIALHNAGKL